jgi:hypothetical protein
MPVGSPRRGSTATSTLSSNRQPTVDGTAVPLHTVSTGAFDVISEPGGFYDQILGVGTGSIRTVVTGDVVFIHPLSPGDHIIEAAIRFTPITGGDFSATYHVHVG